jgi:hypothetical protein
MSEGIKQKMNPDRFVEIFDRYSFEEMEDILQKLKVVYKNRGEQVKEDLQNSLESMQHKISQLENKIS